MVLVEPPRSQGAVNVQIAGPQLATAARLVRPDLPVLYMSGYTAGSLPGGRTLTDDPLLRKPFTTGELLGLMDAALSRAARPTTGS